MEPVNRPSDLTPDEALDSLLAEAKAGASDEWLANQADVSIRQVQLWKKRRGVSSDKGPIQEAVSALQGLAQAYEPSLHKTGEAFDWETPEFLLRRPLDYTQYARACFTLSTIAMFTNRQISRATGTRERDVEQAIALWRRHLSGHGRRCLGCEAIVDPRYTEFCSRSCHDRTVR